MASACAQVSSQSAVSVVSTPGTNSLVGTVADASTGSGVSGVAVIVHCPGVPCPDDERHEFTDYAGRFDLGELPVGSYALTASAVGYSVAYVPRVELGEGQVVHVELVVVRASVELGVCGLR